MSVSLNKREPEMDWGTVQHRSHQMTSRIGSVSPVTLKRIKLER